MTMGCTKSSMAHRDLQYCCDQNLKRKRGVSNQTFDPGLWVRNIEGKAACDSLSFWRISGKQGRVERFKGS